MGMILSAGANARFSSPKGMEKVTARSVDVRYAFVRTARTQALLSVLFAGHALHILIAVEAQR